MNSASIPSFIRTYVPLLVAWLASWLLSFGIEVNESTQLLLIGGLSALIAAVYYAAVRYIERRFPQFGWLLFSNKVPVSVDPTKTVVEQRPELTSAIAVVAKPPQHNE